MTWTPVLVLILAMAIAASKLVRHSLRVLAAMATIVALVWFLAGHAPDPPPGGPRASLTSRTTP
jgi:hypothetical protein